jgi:hypothetical protein
MSVDLTTVNTALMIMAAVALVQMAAMVWIVIWVRRTSLQATQAFDQEIRPVLARLSRAAEVVEATGRGVGAASDDVRSVLSTVTRSAAGTAAAAFAPRTVLAAKLVNWAVRKGVRRWATKGA